MKNNYPFSILVFLLFLNCGKKEGQLFKTPDAEETGIDFVNTITETDDLNILDYLYFYNGGGVALGDINNDGLTDIFFTGNQVKNRLYLNKGDLKFEDITSSAKLEGNSSWNTGTVMGDVNGDGLLDIYVCAVVGLNGFNGFNELYINNGDLTFTESAEKYGLNSESYSSSAVFLDYDLDGDLDIYILNHAVHTQESFGRADLREKRNYQTGDKLMRNDNGVFTDVSEDAGIFGGINGYGLGVSVADFNQDGYPDLYVSNDFHEDDYYYLNNGDGTFSEKLKDYFGHTTRFSMGNDAADINHDAWPDIISLDMLPEDESVLKSSDGDESLQILDLRVKQYGYHYQFTRNMLHINQPNSNYVETALLSGVAATDWSWSGLFADFNQDGEQDLFVSNGIPKRPNNLDFIKFISNEQIKNKINNSRIVDQDAIDMMPSGKSHNYIFKGGRGIVFEDKSGDWTVKDSLISGATAIGDLDNDGDLDIVINNINDPAILYINKTDQSSTYLKIKFDYHKPNRFGIGTKVISYLNGELQYKELYTARGFQSSSEPMIHFGFENASQIDSLRIIWPDRTTQIIKKVVTNQSLVIRPEKAVPFDYQQLQPKNKALFVKSNDNFGVTFEHDENLFNDFNRQKLIPYKISDRGAAIAVGDLNNDEQMDIFLGGSNGQSSMIYLQKDSIFKEYQIDGIRNDSLKEDISAIITDFTGDAKNDLFIGSGGGAFHINTKPLHDSYFIQSDQGLLKAQLPDYFGNVSVVIESDIDLDGDVDLFVASHVVSNDFAKIPESFILENNNGQFVLKDQPELKNLGMVTDAVWTDFDNDGLVDLIVVGEWMAPVFLKNKQGSFQKIDLTEQSLNGLWQSIHPFDIDQDGDLDYLLGNWGTNTKFKASLKYPMKMYYQDFDQDGRHETIVAIEKDGNYFPLAGLDQLSEQMVRLRRKYTTYKEFAGQTIDQIFDVKLIKEAAVFDVHELSSGYLKNDNGKFVFVPFDSKMQVSPITSFLSFDFDNDGENEVLSGGNYFGVQPYHGRFDSFSGALIKNEKDILLGYQIGLDFTEKAVRSLNIIQIKNKPHLLVGVNNSAPEFYELKNY